MTPTNSELRQFINQFFSDEELETLCFDYFPEALNEFGGGMSKNRKVIALIGHCERRERLADLHAAVARERGEAWNRSFAPQPVETPRRDVSPTVLKRDPRQIFLSHATADAEFAHKLAADLRAEGWRVWIAPESIRPGEKWVEAIDRGLETSGVFVVALTPAAVASRWVRTETNAAISMEHRDLIRLIPLDVTETQPSGLWSQYQYIPFRDGYEVGLDALLRQLAETIDTDGYVNWLKSLPDKVFPGKITQGPPPESPPRVRYIKEEQWRQLQALAHEIAAELGKQSGDDELREVYRRFNRHFGLTTYKKLPRRRFDEGLAFFMAWRDEVVVTISSSRNVYEIANSVALDQVHAHDQSVTSEVTQHNLVEVAAWIDELAAEQNSPIEEATIVDGYRVHEKTGIELILIPAGPFLYGSSDAKRIARDIEKPRRTVDLAEYWIGRAPVTNAQYKRFVDSTNRAAPSYWTGKNPLPEKLDHPVVQVSWDDAKAFCDWAGLVLPSEEQWEKAARGTDGRIWPWGDDQPTDKHCNFGGNVDDTTSVGCYSPLGDSPYGCADMAGNVWEWTASWSAWILARRILKGGSWDTATISCRCTSRRGKDPFRVGKDIGFRVLAPILTSPVSEPAAIHTVNGSDREYPPAWR